VKSPPNQNILALSIPINLAVNESVWEKCIEDYFKENKPKTHEEAMKGLEKKLAEMEE
jgi:hypothetical protein